MDDGPGISPAHRLRIFERFYRVDPGRSRDMGGTGLGLSVVHSIIQEHGGQIEVESELKRGSAFHILLPLVRFDSEVAAA